MSKKFKEIDSPYIACYIYGKDKIHVNDGEYGGYNVYLNGGEFIGTFDIDDFHAVKRIPQSCYDEYKADNPEKDEDQITANILWVHNYLPDDISEAIWKEFGNEVKDIYEAYKL